MFRLTEEMDGGVPGNVAEGCKVTCDPELIRQILANLIENAIEHVGGDVEVILQRTTGGALLSINDAGCGVPASKRVKVFERFYRLDRSLAAPGNGLGLSIIKSIADLHGATVTIGESQCRGSAVQIIFPDN